MARALWSVPLAAVAGGHRKRGVLVHAGGKAPGSRMESSYPGFRLDAAYGRTGAPSGPDIG
ncbi:hypothetical protein N566_08845 [Streptomycetaceae bacterium MP113-05]|nr:hypothetical protein N566_08845 [Streptomycetaceae bacterium MP113-05]